MLSRGRQLLPQVLCLGHGQGVRMPQVLQLGPQSSRTRLPGHQAALRPTGPALRQEGPQRPQVRYLVR